MDILRQPDICCCHRWRKGLLVTMHFTLRDLISRLVSYRSPVRKKKTHTDICEFRSQALQPNHSLQQCPLRQRYVGSNSIQSRPLCLMYTLLRSCLEKANFSLTGMLGDVIGSTCKLARYDRGYLPKKLSSARTMFGQS